MMAARKAVPARGAVDLARQLHDHRDWWDIALVKVSHRHAKLDVHARIGPLNLNVPPTNSFILIV
jgi:hypothetical protein